MATTTNYSWTTPDDTALVKDGAAAIRSLGTAIDSTVFNNASAAIAKTIVDAKGDIIAATAADTVARLAVGTNGQVLKANSATATGLEWATDASGMTNPMTTTGDTIYSSSGSTPARLAIGSTGNVLTVAGGVPTWAAPASGSLTLLSTTSLSGSSTTISSISGSYTNLVVSIEGANITSGGNYFRIAPNGTTNQSDGEFTSATNTLTGANNSYIFPTGQIVIGPNVSSENNSITTIYNYASSVINKSVFAQGSTNASAAGFNAGSYRGSFVDSTAITSIVVSTSAGGSMTGNVLIYGVK